MLDFQTQRLIFITAISAYNVQFLISILMILFVTKNTIIFQKRPFYPVLSVVVGNFLFANGAIASCKLTYNFTSTFINPIAMELCVTFGAMLYLFGYMMNSLCLTITQLLSNYNVDEGKTMKLPLDNMEIKFTYWIFDFIRKPSWEIVFFRQKTESSPFSISTVNMQGSSGRNIASEISPASPKLKNDSQKIEVQSTTATSLKPTRSIDKPNPNRSLNSNGRIDFPVFFRCWTYLVLVNVAIGICSFQFYDIPSRSESLSLISVILVLLVGVVCISVTLPLLKILAGIKDVLGIRYEVIFVFVLGNCIWAPFIILYFGNFESIPWFYEYVGDISLFVLQGIMGLWSSSVFWNIMALWELLESRKNYSKHDNSAEELVKTLQNPKDLAILRVQMMESLCQENIFFIEDLMKAYKNAGKPLSYMGIEFESLTPIVDTTEALKLRGRVDSTKAYLTEKLKLPFGRPKLASVGETSATSINENVKSVLKIDTSNHPSNPSIDQAKLVRHIYGKYLSPKSPFELNVPFSIRDEIRQQCHGSNSSLVTLDVLSPVKDEVLKMIQNNNFHRFLKMKKISPSQ